MRIGVVRYWVDRPAAEHEVIERLKGAASARQHEIVELNPDGSALREPEHTPDLDIILNLHYSSPKCRDVPHVGVLWNPLRFYHDFGFTPHFANQLSFDYLATCGSRVVEAAVRPFRPDLFSDGGLPELHHGVPERYLAPQSRRDRRLFYVGVNWERVAGRGGRHDDLLYLLDAADVSVIYGPRRIEGIAPWGGYRTYQGDLPFDGWSVIAAIERAGAALVVTSPAAYRDGIMSSRPFEAAAAGVPIISERHPFMLEHFSDAVLFFDERGSASDQATEIASLMKKLNDDPDQARELAARSQAVLRDRFNLTDQLDRLCRQVVQRHSANAVTSPVTAVVVPMTTAAEFHSWAVTNRDVLARFNEVIVVPPIRDKGWADAVAKSGVGARVEVMTRSDTGWSERAACAAQDLEGPVCFLLGTETLHGAYPQAAQNAVASSSVGLVAAVAVPAKSHLDVNARLPRLLCGAVSTWAGLPVAAAITTGPRVREVRQLLGPGLHLGVLAAAGLERDSVCPQFVPALTVDDATPESWSLRDIAGDEWHRDRQYAQALPAQCTTFLPRSLLSVERAEQAVLTRSRRGHLADVVRKSPLPTPVGEAAISAGKALLRPRRGAGRPVQQPDTVAGRVNRAARRSGLRVADAVTAVGRSVLRAFHRAE